MGLFDLRCGASRLPTDWRYRPSDDERAPRRTVSMFLLERAGAKDLRKITIGGEPVEGRWVPWTPPVRGAYNRVGSIELYPEDATPYAAWVGDTLHGLWSSSLRASPPESLSERRAADPERRVEAYLRVGADVVLNGVGLTIGQFDRRQVRACIVLDEVADAIARADPDPPVTIASAFEAWFPAGGSGREHFDVKACPPEGHAQMIRYASVASFVAGRGGFEPFSARDAVQHTTDQARGLTRGVYEKETGVIRALIERERPEWTARWKVAGKKAEEKAAERAAVEQVVAAAEATPYRPRTTFQKGEVIEHVKFGRGRVEEVDGDKIVVAFGATRKTLAHRQGR